MTIYTETYEIAELGGRWTVEKYRTLETKIFEKYKELERGHSDKKVNIVVCLETMIALDLIGQTKIKLLENGMAKINNRFFAAIMDVSIPFKNNQFTIKYYVMDQNV